MSLCEEELFEIFDFCKTCMWKAMMLHNYMITRIQQSNKQFKGVWTMFKKLINKSSWSATLIWIHVLDVHRIWFINEKDQMSECFFNRRACLFNEQTL